MNTKQLIGLLSFLIFAHLFLASGCSENSQDTKENIEFDYVTESFDVNEWIGEDSNFEQIRIGGKNITVPPPQGFVNATDTEVGEILLQLLESPSFKDYSCYLKEEDFDSLEDENFGDRWEKDYTFFYIRSLKQIEFIDASPSDLLEAKKAHLSNKKNKLREKFEQEAIKSAKENLKNLEIIEQEQDYEISGAKVLPIHDSSDAYFSFVLYSKVKIAGETIVEANVATLIIVNQRLFYLYGTTNNTDSVEDLKDVKKRWVKSILFHDN